MFRCFSLSILGVVVVAACTHSPVSPRKPSSESFSSQESRAFFEGLWAAPRSSERKQTAALLQKWLNAEAKANFPVDQKDKYVLRNYAITKNTLQLTVDYLETGTSCSADQKIRLFRGVGTYQLKERNGRYMIPWSSWTYNSVVEGKPIPKDKQQNMRDNPFEDLSYKTAQQQILANLNKDFLWDNIVEDHSGNGSDTSVLLSTSLEWTVAKTFANPNLVVLDVCPERALAIFAGNIATFGEAEVYLPLFALPEEITAVIQMPPQDPFFEIPAEYTKINAVTQAFRRNFFHADLPFDVQYLTTLAQMDPVTDAGMPNQSAYTATYNSAPFYDLILFRYNNGESIEQWRKKVVQRILQTEASPDVCDFAYENYMNSRAYTMGKKPKKSFHFGASGGIANAKYDLQEYRQVKTWSEAFSAYKDYFDAVKIYREKSYETYLRDCKN